MKEIIYYSLLSSPLIAILVIIGIAISHVIIVIKDVMIEHKERKIDYLTCVQNSNYINAISK